MRFLSVLTIHIISRRKDRLQSLSQITPLGVDLIQSRRVPLKYIRRMQTYMYTHVYVCAHMCKTGTRRPMAQRFRILRRVPGRRMTRRSRGSRKRVVQEAVAHFHAMTSSRIPAYVTGFGKCSFTSYGTPPCAIGTARCTRNPYCMRIFGACDTRASK